MRYTITSQQINHLRKEQNLLLEGLFTPEEGGKILSLHPLGRDAFRENPPLLSSLHLSRIGQVASQLFGKRRIRLAFTQSPPFPNGVVTLNEFSPLSEMIGGALLDLITGEVTFFTPEFPLDFPSFSPSILCLGFALEKGRYLFQQKDPETHFLKKLGYAFGDQVSNSSHPLICK